MNASILRCEIFSTHFRIYPHVRIPTECTQLVDDHYERSCQSGFDETEIGYDDWSIDTIRMMFQHVGVQDKFLRCGRISVFAYF